MTRITFVWLLLVATAASAAHADDRVVVLLGDSTTVSRRAAPGEKYADMVREMLAGTPDMRGITVVNSGKGGDTASGALGRVDNDVAAHDPDVVIVSFGLNDLAQKKLNEFEHDLATLVGAIRSRTRAEVILATSTPFDDRHSLAGKDPYTDPGSLDAALDSKFNAVTRKLAAEQNFILCDQYRAFNQAVTGERFAMTDLLLADGVHLTPAGNRLMAETAVPAICEALVRIQQRGFPGVLPKPKEYREVGKPVLLAPFNQPIRVQVFGQHTALVTGQKDLAKRIESLGGTVAPTEQGATVRVGVASDWPAGASPGDIALCDKPEGYTLNVSAGSEKAPTTIAIRGTDAIGAYYGIQTLIQLLDRNDKGITVRQVKVSDWPTFGFRLFKGQCWYYRDNLMCVEWMSRYKWNVFGSCYTDSPDWREPPETYGRMIADMCETAQSAGVVRTLQLGNPYMIKEKAIRATAAGDVETLADFFEPSLARGSDTLMLCLDDFAYLPDEDAGQFKSLAGANIDIVTRFAKIIWSRHPGTRILLCPPPYWLTANKSRGYEWAHEYLREFSAGIPKEIIIVWTGRSVTTLCHYKADIEAYQELVGADRPLFLWDNTLKMPPGWGNVFRQNSFLADCTDVASSAWPQLASFTNGEAGINTYGPAEIYKLPLMTAADYLWNPESYDSQDALLRALYWFDENPRVGPLVYRWTNSLHQQLYTKRVAFLEKPTPQGLDELRVLTDKLERLFKRIADETANKTLVATLEPYLRRHTGALPILSDVLAGYQKCITDPAEAKKQLQACEAAMSALADQLKKGDIAGDHHGLVRHILEDATLKAIKALVPEQKASE